MILFTSNKCSTKLEQIHTDLAAQQSVFTNLEKLGEAVTQASYVVVQEIARQSKLFSD